MSDTHLAHTSSISFGHAQAPGGKPIKKPPTGQKPVSLASYTTSTAAAKSSSSPNPTPVPLSAFGFASKAVDAAHQISGVRGRSNAQRHPARSSLGSIRHDHDKNAETPQTVDHRRLEKRAGETTLRGVMEHNHNAETTPAPGVPMRRHIESVDHMTATDEGMTHTTSELSTTRGHSVRQSESRIGDMLGGVSTVVPPAPRPHHRAPHNSSESNLVSVGGILTHAAPEQDVVPRMYNIRSGDCSIGDMLGGVSTAPPELPRHHHRVQHNTSESHMNGVLGSGSVEHATGEVKIGTVFGEKGEALRKKHVSGAAAASTMGFCLNQESDSSRSSSSTSDARSKSNSFRSSGSMTSIMVGAPLAGMELVETGSISARKERYMDKTNGNFRGNMSAVLSNVNGQRSARSTVSGLAAPRKGAKTALNRSSIVLGNRGTGIGCSSTGAQWSSFDEDGEFFRFESNEFVAYSGLDSQNVTAFAVSPDGNNCAVAFDKCLHICQYPEVKSIQKHSVARFTLDISKVEYDCSGKFVFVSTGEGGVHIYSITSNKIEVALSSSNKRVVTFSTLEIGNILYVASVDEGGDFRLHKVTVEKGPLGKQYANADLVFTRFKFVHESICNPDSSFGLCMSFREKAGSIQLAVPGTSGSLNMISLAAGASGWTDNVVVAVGNVSHGASDLSMARYSPNGEYLLSADISGRVLLWDASSAEMTALRMWGDAVQTELLDMQWGARTDSDNCALLLTATHSCKLDDVVNVSLGLRLPTDTSTPAVVAGASESEPITSPVVESSSSPAKKASRLTKKELVSEEADDDNDMHFEEYDDTSVKATHTRLDEGDVDDDASYGDEEAEEMDEEVLPGSGVTAEELALQPPIQLSDTSVDERGRRYLIWNHIGSIISREESTGSNRIEIRFANSFSNNKQENLQDHHGYTMTAMSNYGAFFAAPAEPVNDTPTLDRDSTGDSALDKFLSGTNHPGSVLNYHAFSASKALDGTPNDSFKLTMSHQEEAQAVACGTGWCAVATSSDYLRIFSTTGIQLSVTSLKGNVVAMVGDGVKLAVFYHQGIPVAGRPTLALDMFSVTENSATKIQCSLQGMAVPLSRGSTLTWVGFDATEGCLTAMDSQGVLRSLYRAHCNIGTATTTTDDCTYYSWSPVLEVERIKKRFDHTYWPVAVKGSRLLYVLLSGQSKPAIFPQPVIATIHYRLPVVELRDNTATAKDKDAYNDQQRAVLLATMKLTHTENDRQETEDALCSTSHALDAVAYSSLLDTLEEKCDACQKETSSAVLNAFQRACQLGKQSLAVDLVMRYVRGPKALAVAVTIANHHGRAAVARIVDDYARNLQELANEAAPEPTSTPAIDSPSNEKSYTEHSSIKSVLKSGDDSQKQASTGRKLVKKSQAAVSPDSPMEESPQARVTFSGHDEYSQLEEDFSNQQSAIGTQDDYQAQAPRVSPAFPAMKKAPMKNPFAIGLKQGTSTSSPNKGLKRKAGNIFDEVKHNLTTSPSPVKKAASKLNTSSNIMNKLAF